MRKFWVVISVLISILMIVLLSVSYSVKSIVLDTLSTSAVKDESAEVIASLIYDNLDEIDASEKELLEKTIKNSKYLNDITSKYFDSILKDIDKNADLLTSPNIKAESSKLLKECLDAIEKEKEIKLTVEQKQEIINKFVTDQNLNTAYQKTVSLVQNNKNAKVSQLVSTYTFFTSNTVRIVLWGFLATCILIIIIASKPKVSSVLALGLTFLFSGLFIAFIIMPVVNFIGPELAEQISKSSNTIKSSFLSGCGWFLTVLGIITLLIFYGLNKIFNKEKELA